jgi:AraC-like DNA-binding protein
VSADGGGQVAEAVTHRPPEGLRPYVASAVGYHYAGFEAGVHRGLPSRYLTLIVSFDRPLDMTLPGDRPTPLSLDALVGGLHAAPVSIHHDGVQHGVQLQVTPLGARALLGTPASELAHQVVPLDAVFGAAPELGDRLATAQSWPERFAALDDLLGRAIAGRQTRQLRLPRPELAYAYDRLSASAGRLGIATLAAELGWSRRHLADQFRREYGLTPKVLARVRRFERARSLLVSPRRPALAEVAAVCGYADQAHMTHDWVTFAGLSPGAWLAEEQLPFVQDQDAA